VTWRAACLWGVLWVGVCGGWSPAGAVQLPDPAPWSRRLGGDPAPAPFGPGERLGYEVRLGRLSVGRGSLEVLGLESVRGHLSYHVSMGINGGLPLARVNNQLQSWIDVEGLLAHRFIQDQNEVRTKRYRVFEFFPSERRWERTDNGEQGDLPTDSPLDDLSFVYFVRTLPLRVGETYTLDRYFQARGNPVVVQVLRKDRIEVPAGTFNTIVVRPIIQTRGLFSQGGEAEIHFSDDDERLLVQLRSRVPVVGSLSLHLSEIRRGRPLKPFSASRGKDF
jgi:hypothetical protein